VGVQEKITLQGIIERHNTRLIVKSYR
jgi:Reverse transcriptase (RNA-dependent DNA polymerase)